MKKTNLVKYDLYSTLVVIAILLCILFTINSTANTIENKIAIINSSLLLESETHFLEVIARIEKSVVMVIGCPSEDGLGTDLIYYDEELGKCGLGAGFSVNEDGHILTAAHIIKDKSGIVLEGKFLEVDDIVIIEELDLALLKIETDLPPVEFENVLVPKGSSVAFIGYPLGQDYTVVGKGIMSTTIEKTYAINNKYYNTPVYTISAFVNSGNSGGPLFSLNTGKVLGLINRMIEGKSGFAVSSFINSNMINDISSIRN